MDNTHSRVLDQHRWPKVSAGSLNRRMNLMDKSQNSTYSPVPGCGVSPLRRPPSSLQKSQSEVASQITFDQSGRVQYEKHFQWRYANVQAESVLAIQNLAAENTIYSVWNTTFELRDSVVIKRINLQQLKQELKLNIVLNKQIAYLDDWALLEEEHLTSISGATEALEACTLCLPVTSEARADMNTLKKAICSAVDVIQAMASSICSLLSRAEGTNCLVSELANVTAQERALLDECGDLLASTAAVQVEEKSLRTHLMQLKQTLR
ncbi:hypothetical protein GIB67_028479 [Kingdonia uniflora]|uniref:Uncharacterized protein n=1 Tax=Kingdonia uniflora TaxID=39325 RepID=A0A7J7P176_9MAGN|nr:hypothetical protein GIB67_028479 [Kingdonia uniflora]